MTITVSIIGLKHESLRYIRMVPGGLRLILSAVVGWQGRGTLLNAMD
jgi:hypothetical protein